MQKYFEKIIERLEERLKFYETRFEKMGATIRDIEDWGSIKSYKDAIEIVNQVAGECKNDIVWQLAVMYATNFCKHGIDVTAKLETATQNAYAINQAYMRGKQDGLKKFDEWREEYVTDTNVPSNDGWIPCSERLPENSHIHEVTAQFVNGKCYTEFAYYDLIREEWWKHDDDGLVNVIAWKKPSAPYQPKGEK